MVGFVEAWFPRGIPREAICYVLLRCLGKGKCRKLINHLRGRCSLFPWAMVVHMPSSMGANHQGGSVRLYGCSGHSRVTSELGQVRSVQARGQRSGQPGQRARQGFGEALGAPTEMPGSCSCVCTQNGPYLTDGDADITMGGHPTGVKSQSSSPPSQIGSEMWLVSDP